jgi:hypothetical protein
MFACFGAIVAAENKRITQSETSGRRDGYHVYQPPVWHYLKNLSLAFLQQFETITLDMQRGLIHTDCHWNVCHIAGVAELKCYSQNVRAVCLNCKMSSVFCHNSKVLPVSKSMKLLLTSGAYALTVTRAV